MTNLSKAGELFASALDAQQRRAYETAEGLYREALKLAPDRPSVLNNLATVLQSAGKADQSLPFVNRLLQLDNGNPDAWTLLGNAELSGGKPIQALKSFEHALRLKPDHPVTLTNRANALNALGRHNDALNSVHAALQLAPQLAEALVTLGNTLVDLHRPAEAIDSYRAALAQDPENSRTLANLGNALLEAGKVQESLACCEHALSLDPDNANAEMNRGNALRDLGRHDEALASYRRAQQLAPALSEAWWNESLCRLLLGDWAQGWQHYGRRWQLPGQALGRPPLKAPQWTGNYVNGSLLVWAEQGVGDQILFMTMLDDLRRHCRRLMVATDRRLLPLLERTWKDVDFRPKEELLQLEGYAAQAALGDLGQYLRRHSTDFPAQSSGAALTPDREHARRLRARLCRDADQVLCGISWRSTNARTGIHKSLVPEDLLPLLGMDRVRFVDLQYGDTAAERADLQRRHGITLQHCDDIDNFNDLDGLAALIEACDVVVSVSNTTVHLAGALGKPTLVLLPCALGRIWYWHQQGERSLWYPSCRLLRQQQAGDWAPLVAQVAAEFKKLLN
jgi:tetratricopeptide (TPR) repeat protein